MIEHTLHFLLVNRGALIAMLLFAAVIAAYVMLKR